MKTAPRKGRRRNGEGLARPLLSQFRTDKKEYEWIARKVFDLPSKNDFLAERIFPKDWKEQLTAMRREHRRRGEPDTKFYHPRILREMGLPWRPGRRKLRFEKNGGKRGR